MTRDASYYQALGVQKDATDRELRDAYRKLLRQYHPDRARATGISLTLAHQRTQEIITAYQVLSNPAQRRAYDKNPKVSIKLASDDQASLHAYLSSLLIKAEDITMSGEERKNWRKLGLRAKENAQLFLETHPNMENLILAAAHQGLTRACLEILEETSDIDSVIRGRETIKNIEGNLPEHMITLLGGRRKLSLAIATSILEKTTV